MAPEQHVAHGPAHDPDARDVSQGVEQPAPHRARAQPLEQVVGAISHSYHRSPCRRRLPSPRPGGGSSSGRARRRAAPRGRRRRLTSCSRSRATSPTPTSSSAPSRPRPPAAVARRGKREDDVRAWPLYGYSPNRAAHYLPPRSTLRPPFERTWSWTADSLLEFTPVIAEGKLYMLKNNGALYAITAAHRQVRLAPQARLARRLLARLRRRPHLRDDPRARRLQGRPRRRAARQGRRRLVEAAARAAPSPRRCSPTAGSTSAPRTAPSTRCGPATAACAGATRRPARSRAAPALADGKLYFGDYGGRVHAIRQSDGKQAVVGRDERRRASARSSGQLLRARRPSPTAASTSATRTATSTRSRAATGKLAWRTRTGSYVYASAAVAQVPGGKPTVYVGSYDGASTRSTRGPARSAGSTRRRAGSPARPPSSATSSTSATSSRAHDRRSARARAARSSATAAAASTPSSPTGATSTSSATPRCRGSGRAERPHRHARGGQVRLDLADRVAPVVEDRGAAARRRRRPRSASTRCSSSPAPPEAMTGTSTGAATARVARGRSRPSCRRGP